MDIVITYVNGLDPIWQQEYAKHTNTPILEKRFRDWGTLKYLFRGIETNMPFIRKVHLVVSGESQVPKWLNREQVNVVLHKDIIPAQLLPTFNCNPIEMHLHNIADLDEEYIYFNDDIFPLLPCPPIRAAIRRASQYSTLVLRQKILSHLGWSPTKEESSPGS